MSEIDIDISAHESKTLESLDQIEFDQVVTVCAHADEHCPTFRGNAKVTHIGFDDPPKLAQNAQTEEQALNHYRRVRDEIGEFIHQLPRILDT
jgi:arsenate reductase